MNMCMIYDGEGKVVVRANYLVISHLFGIVMKHSELIRVEK